MAKREKRKSANGGGTIFKQKRNGQATGKWIADVTIGYDAANKRLHIRQIFDKESEARDWRAKQLVDRKQGALLAPVKRNERQTVGQYLTHWLETTIKDELKSSTYNNYRDQVRAYMLPVLGHVPLPDLTVRHVTDFKHTLLTENPFKGSKWHKKPNNLSSRTVQLVMTVLRMGLEAAKEEGLLHSNPADVKRARRAGGARSNAEAVAQTKKVKYLTPDQVEAFLEAAKGDRLHALFVVAVTTGLRIGELLALPWSAVDLKAGRLTVSQALVKEGGRFVIGTPKSETSNRVVPLVAEAIDALRKWQTEQTTERKWFLRDEEPSELVFTAKKGTQLNPSNIRNRVLPSILEKAGLSETLTPHSLRHTCASYLHSLGIPMKVISQILGHSDERITSSIYTHVWDEQKEEAAAKLQASLAARRKTR